MKAKPFFYGFSFFGEFLVDKLPISYFNMAGNNDGMIPGIEIFA
jgi:hypothetical protein